MINKKLIEKFAAKYNSSLGIYKIPKFSQKHSFFNELKPSSKLVVMNWIQKNLPDIILDKIVECKQLKQCGALSSYIAMKAVQNNILAGTLNYPGHIVTCFPISNNVGIIVDATYLQFEFPSYGGLRDFSREDREIDHQEYMRMNKLFEDLKVDPMKAVKIYKDNFLPEDLNLKT